MITIPIYIAALLCFSALSCFGQARSIKPESVDNKKANVRQQLANNELASLKSFLENRGIAPSKAGIQQYLQQIANPNFHSSPAAELIEQLGSNNYLERVAAEKSLMELSVIPEELLRREQQNSDLEKAFPRKKCPEEWRASSNEKRSELRSARLKSWRYRGLPKKSWRLPTNSRTQKALSLQRRTLSCLRYPRKTFLFFPLNCDPRPRQTYKTYLFVH